VAEAVSYIRLSKADFKFCAAHFCVFPDGREPLHGHNYRVYAELRGAVDSLGYVAEFGWLKRIVRELANELDHRVLIAAASPELQTAEQNGQLELRWRDDRWAFPVADVVRLPIRNTTAELLAEYVWHELSTRIGGTDGWSRLTVEVEETPGQRAGISRDLGS